MNAQSLGESGRRLHADLTAKYDLDPGEEALLNEACRSLDELEHLKTALEAGAVMVSGSTGQPRANPLLEEIRRHRLNMATLLKQLTTTESGSTTLSQGGRAAAKVRWGRTRAPRLVS